MECSGNKLFKFPITVSNKQVSNIINVLTYRATSLFPRNNLGIVGQHIFCIEATDINSDGTLIASSSHNNIKFWNVQYFETLDVAHRVKGGK